jgi:hypothetical protein
LLEHFIVELHKDHYAPRIRMHRFASIQLRLTNERIAFLEAEPFTEVRGGEIAEDLFRQFIRHTEAPQSLTDVLLELGNRAQEP